MKKIIFYSLSAISLMFGSNANDIIAKSPFLNMKNELIAATLISGAEYNIALNNYISSLPVLLNFNYKSTECVAFGVLHPDKKKSTVNLMNIKCGNELFNAHGYFVDVNKNFGAITTLNKEDLKYTVAAQSGFIMLSDIAYTLNNTNGNIPIQKYTVFNAELETSTQFDSNTITDNLNNPPLLISFENDNTTCKSIGMLDIKNETPTVRFSSVKCGDDKTFYVDGLFINANKTLGVEKIIDSKDTYQKSIPLQSGYVFIY